jgi:hypothetical protein
MVFVVCVLREWTLSGSCECECWKTCGVRSCFGCLLWGSERRESVGYILFGGLLKVVMCVEVEHDVVSSWKLVEFFTTILWSLAIPDQVCRIQ